MREESEAMSNTGADELPFVAPARKAVSGAPVPPSATAASLFVPDRPETEVKSPPASSRPDPSAATETTRTRSLGAGVHEPATVPLTPSSLARNGPEVTAPDVTPAKFPAAYN